jgi:two-component system NarL family sensor kinase
MHSPNSKVVILIFIISTLLVMLLLGFILLILAVHRRKKQNFAIELERVKTTFEKEILQAQLEMQEQTFQYISQEIHDNIGQFISLAKLQLNTLDFLNVKHAREKVADSADMLTRALDDLRDLSKSLSSEIIRTNGLATAIELQIAQLKKLEFPAVVYEVEGEYQFLDEQKEIFILRILQEAINNIIRHSDARQVSILLSYCEGYLALWICDNGKGFDPVGPRDPKASGINNMKKRARMIGADYNIESSPGDGTKVLLSVPY